MKSKRVSMMLLCVTGVLMTGVWGCKQDAAPPPVAGTAPAGKTLTAPLPPNATGTNDDTFAKKPQ